MGSYLLATAETWGKKKQLSLAVRSICLKCMLELRWFELIPIVSWIFQKGRCLRCGWRIPIYYLGSEILVGFVFAIILVNTDFLWETLVLCILSSVFLLLAFIDIRTQYLPDKLTLSTAAILSIFLLFTRQLNLIQSDAFLFANFSNWIWGAIVGAGFIALLVALTRGQGMGLGDAKLMLPIGMSLGGPLTILSLMVAFVSGAIIGIGLLLLGRATRKTAIPFGPFLVFGWLVSALWGESLLRLVLY